jgi:virulence factor Mce-like protein
MENRRSAAIIGGAAVAVIVVLVALLFAYVGGDFKSGYEVEATFARAGQLLNEGSDVKMRGVLVGSVRSVEVERASGRAVVTLLLDETQDIPGNVSAAIRAKTLFGEKFIDLIPAEPSSGQLRRGDAIPQDRTIPPIEVETILEKGVPILEAVDPEAFGGALHALATGLVGNEQALRRATVQSEKLLTATERTLPDLERNLVHLRNFASALNATDSDLLDALDGLTLVGEALRDHPEAFRETVSGLVPLARDLGDVIGAREADLGVLASEQRAILEEVRERKDKLPGIVKVLDGFLGVWVADLSEGPYWRISVTDPPVLLGTPYGAGEAPAPRAAALATLRNDATGVDELLRVLLAPIPDADLREATEPLAKILTNRFGGPR